MNKRQKKKAIKKKVVYGEFSSKKEYDAALAFLNTGIESSKETSLIMEKVISTTLDFRRFVEETKKFAEEKEA